MKSATHSRFGAGRRSRDRPDRRPARPSGWRWWCGPACRAVRPSSRSPSSTVPPCSGPRRGPAGAAAATSCEHRTCPGTAAAGQRRSTPRSRYRAVPASTGPGCGPRNRCWGRSGNRARSARRRSARPPTWQGLPPRAAPRSDRGGAGR